MLTATHKLEFKSGKRTAKTIVEAGSHPEQPIPVRIPRITKMMALAIRLDHLIKTGQVTDQAELARVGHVSRARLSQILDLNLLAPKIQESVLSGSAPRLLEKELHAIVRNYCWEQQIRVWIQLCQTKSNRDANAEN